MAAETSALADVLFGDSATVLRRFTTEPVASACWRRTLAPDVRADASRLRMGPAFRNLVNIDHRCPDAAVAAVLEGVNASAIARDLRQLLALHILLMPGAARRLRVERIDDDGCRRFHTDRVESRLLCTYAGAGTVCLPSWAVDSARAADGTDGHVMDATAAWSVDVGWVLLMRGSASGGLAQFHRSPPRSLDGARLLVAIDA